MALIKILSSEAEYFTITDVEIPVPPVIFEFNVRSILSNSANPCEVETATCAVISCALPRTWLKFDLNWYSKLLEGAVLKNIRSPPFSVVIPIKFFEILCANKLAGKLKLAGLDLCGIFLLIFAAATGPLEPEYFLSSVTVWLLFVIANTLYDTPNISSLSETSGTSAAFIVKNWLLLVAIPAFVNGIIVVAAVPHTIAPAPLGTVNVIGWLFVNGWSGKKICLAGMLITSDNSPIVNDFAVATTVPAVNARPTCSCGLKNTLSLILESKGSVIRSIVNFWGTVNTGVDNVWAEPTTPLLTLKIFLWSNLFKTNNLSVPIPMLLPADTLDGIEDT